MKAELLSLELLSGIYVRNYEFTFYFKLVVKAKELIDSSNVLIEMLLLPHMSDKSVIFQTEDLKYLL